MRYPTAAGFKDMEPEKRRVVLESIAEEILRMEKAQRFDRAARLERVKGRYES